jgi:hypothetical protein
MTPASFGGPSWSDEEDALLDRLWPVLGIACADQFKRTNRTKRAVKERAKKRHLRSPFKAGRPKGSRRNAVAASPFKALERKAASAPLIPSIWHYAAQQGEQA